METIKQWANFLLGPVLLALYFATDMAGFYYIFSFLVVGGTIIILLAAPIIFLGDYDKASMSRKLQNVKGGLVRKAVLLATIGVLVWHGFFFIAACHTLSAIVMATFKSHLLDAEKKQQAS